MSPGVSIRPAFGRTNALVTHGLGFKVSGTVTRVRGTVPDATADVE